MKYSVDLEKTGRTLFPYYLAIVFLAPLPLGSNRVWAWATLAVFSFVLLFIYLWNFARQNLRSPEITTDIKFVLLLLFTWICFQIFQLIPLPVETLNLISPKTLFFKQIAFSGSEITNLPLSFDVSAGMRSIYKTSLYCSMFILTICLVQSRDRLRLLMLTMVFIGVIQAVWGMSDAFLNQVYLRNGELKEVFNIVTGTFVNRNHFAGFMNLSVAALIGLLLASGLREKRRIHRDKYSSQWQSRALDWRVYLIPYFGLILMSMILSQSRGGLFSFICMLIVMVVSLLIMKVSVKQLFFSFKYPIMIVTFVIIFSIANFMTQQLAVIDQHLDTRLDHWVNSFMIIKDFNLTGVGAGNFQFVYPLYDSGFVEKKLIHAHNDYLEILVEQGIIGFTLLALIVLICIKNAIQAIRRHSSLRKSAYAIASLIAISGFLVHSTIDFNFQIPSNAMYFFIYLAIALLQGMNSVHKEKRETVWDDEAFDNSLASQNAEPSVSIQNRNSL